jgi:thymidine phosphorylase
MPLIKSNKYFAPAYTHEIKAKSSGYINYRSAKSVGLTSFYLGAGRLRKTDSVDYHAGIFLNKIRNEHISKGDLIATLYSSKPISLDSIKHFINNTEINHRPIKSESIIMAVLK